MNPAIMLMMQDLVCDYRSRIEWSQRPVFVAPTWANEDRIWMVATSLKAMIVLKDVPRENIDDVSKSHLNTIEQYGDAAVPAKWHDTTLSDLWSFFGTYRRIRCDICAHESWKTTTPDERIFPCEDCQSKRYVDSCSRQVVIEGARFDADLILKHLRTELQDMYGDRCKYGVVNYVDVHKDALVGHHVLLIEDIQNRYRIVIMSMLKSTIAYSYSHYIPGIGQFGDGFERGSNWFAVADWLEENGLDDIAISVRNQWSI